MKINLPSIVIGAFSAILIFSFTDAKPQESAQLQIVPYLQGTGIYNPQTRTLYHYKISPFGSTNTKPSYIMEVSPDGSSMSEVRKKD